MLFSLPSNQKQWVWFARYCPYGHGGHSICKVPLGGITLIKSSEVCWDAPDWNGRLTRVMLNHIFSKFWNQTKWSMYSSLHLAIRGKGMLGLAGTNHWILRLLEGNAADSKPALNILDTISQLASNSQLLQKQTWGSCLLNKDTWKLILCITFQMICWISNHLASMGLFAVLKYLHQELADFSWNNCKWRTWRSNYFFSGRRHLPYFLSWSVDTEWKIAWAMVYFYEQEVYSQQLSGFSDHNYVKVVFVGLMKGCKFL